MHTPDTPSPYSYVKVELPGASGPEVALTDTQTRDEGQERRHLDRTLQLLATERGRVDGSIETSARRIDEQKELMWTNRRDMDFAEKASLRTDVDMSVKLAESAVTRRDRIDRLLDSPYFGRVDFCEQDEAEPEQHYIGVHNFSDPATQQIVIHDWRAPLSSLFYDFETGPAHFEAPAGTTRGEITGKRQYKIQGGSLEYMLESALNISDDVLQRELSQSADDRMKNIVATIQREQNAVIRNESAQVLLLQGVAGSGKTSIALHRVAFLLYRFHKTLSADNVMILSPNQVFSDYISDVLPELGEQRVAEIGFDRIAEEFLKRVTDFQTFNEQVIGLLDGLDDAAAARMRHKASPEFVTELDAWIDAAAQEFAPAEIAQRHQRLTQDWVVDMFDQAPAFPIFTRVEHVANCAVGVMKNAVRDRGGTWTAADTNGVRRQVRAMFPYKDAFALYRAFYRAPQRRGLFVPLGRKKIEYADVFPLIYTMTRTSRHTGYGRIRHLVVDEMQDYTPIQYAVLRALFSCTMTILGDANQSVNPLSSSSLATIHSIFPDAHCLELNKSYRSTTEITEFAQHISRNDKLVPVSRHGSRPRIWSCPDRAVEHQHIAELVTAHRNSDQRSLGIVCKTVEYAGELHQALSEAAVESTLLDYDSTAFTSGVVLTSAHIAKGLEFDSVIVPHVDATTYATEMDRHMLYIACTRAMHELHLTHHGPLSPLLDSAAATAIVSDANTATTLQAG